MVDAKLVSLACTAIGVIGALVGAVVGVLFILSEEFVVATIQCNTTVPDSLGNSTNCVDNSLVAAGEVCQVGNLGLFKAGFTPECTYGQVGYEISSQLQPFESNPTEFGILFPAQTNFAGLFPGIEFTTCEEFFDNALLASAFQAAGVSQLTSGFGTFEEEIKNEFEDGINVTLRGLVDGLTPLLCPSAYVELATTLTGSGLAPPANVSEPYVFVIEHASYSAALVAAGQTFIASLFVEQGGIVSPFTLFVTACNTGYTGLSGLPATGFFSPVGSSVLCLLSTGSPSCSYADFIDANNDDAQIKPLDDLLKGYIAGANADTSESAELLKLLLGGSVEAADIEELVRIVQTQNITGSFLQATVGSVTFATTILNTGFSKESLYAQIFNAFRAKDAVPDAFLAPARLEVPEFALICGFANYSTPLDENCTLLGLLTAVATDARAAADALALNPLVPEVVLFQVESAARNVELLQGTLGGCAFFGITSLATCLTTAPAFVFNPATEQTLTDLVAESLFGSFYGLTEGQNITSYFAEATGECEDDEKDIAAITQAQQLVPPGVALGFVGALGAAVAIILAALGKGGNAPKIITLVSGVVALVGVALVLVALLGVQQAPIYQSVGGGDGPIEDNNRLFSQGSGYLLALISLAGGLVGSIFVIVGGALMFCSSSESSDILAKPNA